MTHKLRHILLASGAALLLSAGAAVAAPATAQSDLNVRSGPGTQYPVVGSIQSGEAVNVGGCTGSWCRVSFSGGSGYANSSYLAMGGGGGPAVAVAPGYVDPGYAYDDTPDYAYNDDYYDSGYGPGVSFYYGGGFRHRHHGWNGRPGWNGGNHVGGNWQGRGNWQGNRVGGIGRPGSVSPQISGGGVGRAQFSGGGVGRAQMSAPTGMRMGGGGGGGFRAGGGGGGAAHIGGGGGGGGGRPGGGVPGR